MAHQFTLGAFAIMIDQQQHVLLCHRRDRDAWGFPGGGVESRELPSEAVIREVKEETGLNVVIDRLIGVYGKNDRDDLVFVFQCHPVGGQLTITDESDDCRYFDPKELPMNTLAREWQIERIGDAMNLNSQPVFRRQIRSVSSTR